MFNIDFRKLFAEGLGADVAVAIDSSIICLTSAITKNTDMFSIVLKNVAFTSSIKTEEL